MRIVCLFLQFARLFGCCIELVWSLYNLQIDPVFQEECKKYFSFENLGVGCTYTPAPVKTRARAIEKAIIDYKHESWPHTSNVTDYVRCSVLFDTVSDLIIAYKKFWEEFGGLNSLNKRKGCIKGIVRVKNGFFRFRRLAAKSMEGVPLSEFDYSDIKFNILIQHKKTRLIGEIQFLLDFMLTAKKMGHAIYKFLRKEEFYSKLNKLMMDDTNSESIFYNFIKFITFKNLNELAEFYTTINKQEKLFILENRDRIRKLFEKQITQEKEQQSSEKESEMKESESKENEIKSQIEWEKGYKFFNIMVQEFENQEI